MQLFEHAHIFRNIIKAMTLSSRPELTKQRSRFCISACKRLSDTVSFTFYNFVLVCKRKMLLIGELESNNSY